MLNLILEFHRDAERQGPGSDEMTLRALGAVPNSKPAKSILDIGCGTGAQTMVLAKNTQAQVTAVDITPMFLEALPERARTCGVEHRIQPMEMSMDALSFPDGSFDLVWAEGCIYHIGFEWGLREWKRLLRPDGCLVVSEICWLTETRPQELHDYWVNAYSEIDTIPAKEKVISDCGYTLLEHFILPESCWTDHYYTPIRERTAAFAEQYGYVEGVRDFLDAGLEEADLYDRYKEYYSYVFFIMRCGDE
ncbi:class I SAM-dependent methyltransferase [Ruminococcaceae bacterium OttesenSCG-928-I18]|nr:class I SAM-dependent methyltransferase [Ruminococcaceae bacterium OttesenSCG-928-I18]